MTTSSGNVSRPEAVDQDGSYPRPQLRRSHWADLSGTWDFASAPVPGVGPSEVDFDTTITVPFPPESKASGVGDPGYRPVVWYRRLITQEDLDRAGLSEHRPRLMLRFGAVDWRADVWLGGQHVADHEGGQTPFSCDVTRLVVDADGPVELIVRALDDPLDVEQPRGKQDWREQPHSIWYHRTTGIWQPVWLEAVPVTHVERLVLEPDLPGGALDLTLELDHRPAAGVSVEVALDLAGDTLARHRVWATERLVELRVVIDRLRNGQAREELWWTPETPTLIGVSVEVDDGDARDVVASYTGMRSVGVEDRAFLLNDRPYVLRSVLEQGYWPESHLAAPSPAALREEVEAIKRLGFNAVRIHQKAEAPGFLYWADRLGLLVWVETANAYAYSDRAVQLLVREWLEIVRRDRSHPCVVTWVPLNESWGIQQVQHVAAQRHYAQALASITRALDGSRPVVSNDGWEHVDSDIWTIHDYTPSGVDITRRYGSREAVSALLEGFGPSGRRIRIDGAADRGQPFMLTEFGGISYDPHGSPDTWGYSTATSPDDLQQRLVEVLDAANEAVGPAGGLAGYCYTQLVDTGQETNGLLFDDRTPKLPWDILRAIVLGHPDLADTDPDHDVTGDAR